PRPPTATTAKTAVITFGLVIRMVSRTPFVRATTVAEALASFVGPAATRSIAALVEPKILTGNAWADGQAASNTPADPKPRRTSRARRTARPRSSLVFNVLLDSPSWEADSASVLPCK